MKKNKSNVTQEEESSINAWTMFLDKYRFYARGTTDELLFVTQSYALCKNIDPRKCEDFSFWDYSKKPVHAPNHMLFNEICGSLSSC